MGVSLEYQFESKASPLQIGGMFYGVRKGSGVARDCWIGLHCSVALLKVVARFLLDVLESSGIIFLPTTRGRT